MATSKGSSRVGKFKAVADIVESKSVCLPRKFWKRLQKEAGDLSVTKYAGSVLENHCTEANVKKVAFVYDVEEYILLAIIFGTEMEVSDYWQNNFDVNSTLYTFEPTQNFSDVRVAYAGKESGEAEG